jgi:type I restriction enzyme S subunit
MAGEWKELPLPDELPAIPDGWIYKSLGDLVDERGVSYGIVQPGSETTDGVPIVRVNNIRNGRIDTTDMLKVGADIEAKFQRSRLRGGEVLLTLVGTLGEVAIVPDNLRGWNVARAVGVIPVRNDPGNLWVSICLRSAFIQHCIRTWATTTVQATFNLRDLAKLPIPIPPTETRNAIAAVLGALDDKIELNRRMNATLEATVRALFQSWFVDFDPVRAKLDGRKPTGIDPDVADLFPAAFQESVAGYIPKGWRLMKVGEFIDRLSVGQKYEQKTVFPAGKVPVLDQGKSGVIGYHNNEPGVTATLDKPVAVFANHTCYMRLITYPFSVIQNVLPFVGSAVNTFWAYYATEGRLSFSEYKGHWPDFVIQETVVPSRELTDVFGRLIKPLVEQMRNNEDQSRTLATLRDTLLPKLLSGELRVEGESQ